MVWHTSPHQTLKGWRRWKSLAARTSVRRARNASVRSHPPAPCEFGCNIEKRVRTNHPKSLQISGAGAVGGALPGVDMNVYNGMELLSISREEGRLLRNIGYFDLKPKVF